MSKKQKTIIMDLLKTEVKNQHLYDDGVVCLNRKQEFWRELKEDA